jgi:hypothetical protein
MWKNVLFKQCRDILRGYRGKLLALDFHCNSCGALAHAETASEHCLAGALLFYEVLKSFDYPFGSPQKARTAYANLYLYHGRPSGAF